VAAGTGAASGTYTSNSSNSVHSEKGFAGSAPAHEFAQDTDSEGSKAASATQESSPIRESAASDEVISLPADAPTTAEEDKK
jgi:hypothetical protein